jgi:tryptophan synthase beta chain
MLNTEKSRAGIARGVSVPEKWLNLAAQVGDFPLPRHPSGETVTHGYLSDIFSIECAHIELLDDHYRVEPFIQIPDPVHDEYRKYRPTELRRARGLEKRLSYDGQIYFKREDLNPGGSHKPNTAIPQAYYARQQGLQELVTDTGAGQWGAALAWACHNLGLRCTVFMTRNSYLSKPYRRALMQLCGANVYASPSHLTSQGRAIVELAPDHRGSLGIGMGEAMEYLGGISGARLALGCMSYYAALHQTIIGQELVEQLQRDGIAPDILIGCVGGGTNFIGFVSPFVKSIIEHRHLRNMPRLVAVESANVPVLTKGEYRYEHADAFGLTPLVKMYTLGRQFLPADIHAGGLRYHGKSPILSLLVDRGIIEALAVSQEDAFKACKMFFESEGILPAPESGHAIACVIAEAEREKQNGRASTIVFCLSGTGYLDIQAYMDMFKLVC